MKVLRLLVEEQVQVQWAPRVADYRVVATGATKAVAIWVAALMMVCRGFQPVPVLQVAAGSYMKPVRQRKSAAVRATS
jgi:hypothetical protein